LQEQKNHKGRKKYRPPALQVQSMFSALLWRGCYSLKISGTPTEIKFLSAMNKMAMNHREANEEAKYLCRALAVILFNGEGDLVAMAKKIRDNDKRRTIEREDLE
jgi:hypothetical protein